MAKAKSNAKRAKAGKKAAAKGGPGKRGVKAAAKTAKKKAPARKAPAAKKGASKTLAKKATTKKASPAKPKAQPKAAAKPTARASADRPAAAPANPRRRQPVSAPQVMEASVSEGGGDTGAPADGAAGEGSDDDAAEEPASARARGVTVDAFLNAQPAPQRALMAALRDAIKQAVPSVLEGIKWGQPVYEHHGPMVFMRPAKSHVTFGFWRGADLEQQGFAGLEGDGDRMRHLKIASESELDRDLVGRLVAAAAQLNERLGNPTKRR